VRLFGLELTTRARREAAEQKAASGAMAVGAGYGSGGYSGGFGGWFSGIISEPFTGAWQRNIFRRPETVLSFHAVFACVTLIASDISKLRIKLVEKDGNGIWNETTSPAFSPILMKPNNYQNRIQFIEAWITSKLIHGNAYILKERDGRGVVVGLSVLDPVRTKPLVAPDGSVYYELSADWLAGVQDAQPPVPASEIIHDRMNSLFHPLVGISPLYACGLPASQGLNIQRNSTAFFGNGARPGGILSAPEKINDETARRIKEHWDSNFTGANVGKVAVLGDGLTYSSMVMSAVDSQLIDQLKMSAEQVCSTFHVPPFMVGLAEMPVRVTVEAFNQQYYTQCLQHLIESLELCLDEGLNLVNVQGRTYGTELDLDGLLRMDQASQFKAYGDAILAGLMKPNEGREKINLPPAAGGDEVYLQQQNYSLSALAKRDAQADPFGTAAPAQAPPADTTPTANDNAAANARHFALRMRQLTGAVQTASI
jgi:HK97 family phage portal protein